MLKIVFVLLLIYSVLLHLNSGSDLVGTNGLKKHSKEFGSDYQGKGKEDINTKKKHERRSGRRRRRMSNRRQHYSDDSNMSVYYGAKPDDSGSYYGAKPTGKQENHYAKGRRPGRKRRRRNRRPYYSDDCGPYHGARTTEAIAMTTTTYDKCLSTECPDSQ